MPVPHRPQPLVQVLQIPLKVLPVLLLRGTIVVPSTPTAASLRMRRKARPSASSSSRCANELNRASGSRFALSATFRSPGDMRAPSLCLRSCFPPEALPNSGRLCSAGSRCQAGSPPSSLLRGHPTPLSLRHASGLPSAVPYHLLKRRFCARWHPCHEGRPPDRLLPTARWRGSPVLHCPDSQMDVQGSPRLPGHPLRPRHGRPPRRSPSARPCASGGAAFREVEPLSIQEVYKFRGCIPVAHPLA